MFVETSYSTEWALQSVVNAVSFGSTRHFPLGKDMLDLPKSVRSKITTLSLLRSCMCMAETPMLGFSKTHLPPEEAAWVRVRHNGPAVRNVRRKRERERN